MDKTKRTSMLLPPRRNAGQNHDMKIPNRSYENAPQFQYWGTRVTNENWIHEEINGALVSDNVCCYSAQNILSSHLLSSKNLYKTIIFCGYAWV
jgi:hypothetical protein